MTSQLNTTDCAKLPSSWDSFVLMINEALDGYCHFDADCPPRLQQAMRYSLLGPGKRLRPLLSLFAAEACGGEIVRALPAACAVEMVHAYSLIHDDLPAMDDDKLRRGRPTCHVKFDEATAILAGDALLTRAFEILASDVEPASVARTCCRELAAAAGARNLVGGQSDDLSLDEGDQSLDHLVSIHRRKTGAMFLAPLRIGAISATGNTPPPALDCYGANLGLAFQIVDDLLDSEGNQAAVGKKTGKDQDQGKLTFPGLLGTEASRKRANELISEACQAAEFFGERKERLMALAEFVLSRDR